MTHTAHRSGELESLQNDFVFLMMSAKGFNDKEATPKFKKFLEIAKECEAISVVDASKGHEKLQGSFEKMLENVHDRSVVHAVFDQREKVVEMLELLKKEGLGLSVVISGLLDTVHECCQEVGLKRHTVLLSSGIWGKTEKLPAKEVLDLHTMCGHGMVSAGLIEDIVEKVKEGLYSPEEGAEKLYEPCTCGIFNTSRAVEIIKKLSEA